MITAMAMAGWRCEVRRNGHNSRSSWTTCTHRIGVALNNCLCDGIDGAHTGAIHTNTKINESEEIMRILPARGSERMKRRKRGGEEEEEEDSETLPARHARGPCCAREP